VGKENGFRLFWFAPPMSRTPLLGRAYDRMPASSWIRCLRLVPSLERLGCEVEINPRSAENAPDAAVFLRRWSDADLDLAETLRKRGTRIILDTPANYFSDADSPRYRGGARNECLRFAETADLVTCPSEFTAAAARNRGFRAEAVPDAVDPDMFPPRSGNGPDKPVLAWSGVASKAEDLNVLARAVRRNAWKVRIISNEPPKLDFDYEFVKWRHKSFPAEIAESSLGVFPRRLDDDYDKGHSFFKIGVFLARRVPVVCSPVPSYAEIATQRNSITVDSLDPDAWETAVGRILDGSWRPDFTDNPVERFTPDAIAGKLLSTILDG